jgi:hypothetical protein
MSRRERGSGVPVGWAHIISLARGERVVAGPKQQDFGRTERRSPRLQFVANSLVGRETDSNPRSPVYGELGARGPRATSSASDLRYVWGGFHVDKAGLELEIEHLAASLFSHRPKGRVARKLHLRPFLVFGFVLTTTPVPGRPLLPPRFPLSLIFRSGSITLSGRASLSDG